ncbi:MAG TPA: dihydrolipoamide acetyltransferase family protein [Ktedonobacteraceae bacterium]
MPTPVKMPRLGESVAEGTVGAWLKNEGDYVEKDESLAEIITDKMNAELPSPIAGRLTKILVAVDETVPVDADIALIEESADVAASLPPQEAPEADVAPVHVASETPLSAVDLRAGSYDNSSSAFRRPVVESRQEEEERQRISPLARRLAREHGVELGEIVGTGSGGRVRKEDILSYVAGRQRVEEVPASSAPSSTIATIASSSSRTASVSSPVPETVAGIDEEVIVPSRMRLAIAEHMVRSKHTSPHATTLVEVDMTNIARWLEKNKEAFKQREGYGISYVPFVMKAVCEGIRKFPIINSTWTADNKIIIKKRINLGVAVATEGGLVVPTLYDADQYTLAGLARQVSLIAQRARTNKLTVQDMQNSTFVVNNPGIFGTIISMPIINQPHAGILSMDAVVKRAVVVEDDAIAVRSMMYISLSFDHRILDGVSAGGFLQAVRNKLQSYGREIDVY